MDATTRRLGDGSRTDRDLLDRVREVDDEGAWGAFLAEYDPRIRRWIRRPGLDDEAVDELVQRVRVRLASRMRTFQYDPSRTFRGWLRRVAENVVIDYIGERKAWWPPLPPAFEPASTAREPDEDDAPHPLFERARKIQDAVRATVSESTWGIFERCRIEDEPVADVARDLGMSFAAVYMAVDRVTRKLVARGRLDLLDAGDDA